MRNLLTIAFLMSTTVISHASEIGVIKVAHDGTTEIWAKVVGEIVRGDGVKFLNLIDKNPELKTVWLDSPGGLVVDGMQIAELIKATDMNTYVHTNTSCDSICAIMFLSGKTKFANQTSHIGFHAAFDTRTNKRSPEANVKIGWYLGSLGYSIDTVNVWFNTSPESIVNVNDAGLRDELDLGITELGDSPEDKSTWLSRLFKK